MEKTDGRLVSVQKQLPNLKCFKQQRFLSSIAPCSLQVGWGYFSHSECVVGHEGKRKENMAKEALSLFKSFFIVYWSTID